ncbi:MAG: response regulator [Rhodothermales bacterium]|nr:response regulator [Rhodothermales bacterium]
MTPTQLCVLIVEDDEDDFGFLRDDLLTLVDWSYTIDWALSVEDALEKLHNRKYDLCFLDYHLGAYTGHVLLNTIPASGLVPPFVMLTGVDDGHTDARSIAAGAADYLVKGKYDTALLARTIRLALARKHRELQQGEAYVWSPAE